MRGVALAFVLAGELCVAGAATPDVEISTILREQSVISPSGMTKGRQEVRTLTASGASVQDASM